MENVQYIKKCGLTYESPSTWSRSDWPGSHCEASHNHVDEPTQIKRHPRTPIAVISFCVSVGMSARYFHPAAALAASSPVLLLDDESLLDGHQLLFLLRLVCEEEHLRPVGGAGVVNVLRTNCRAARAGRTERLGSRRPRRGGQSGRVLWRNAGLGEVPEATALAGAMGQGVREAEAVRTAAHVEHRRLLGTVSRAYLRTSGER